jgi:uncharacterized membrane protein
MTETIFRRLIIFWWLLNVVGIVLVLSTERYLPIELSSYVEAQANAELTTIEMTAAIIGLALFGVLIVATIGLYFFKKWSRGLFVLTNVGFLLLHPFLGPWVMSEWESGVWYVCSLLTGGLLFAMYLPPLNQIFAGTDDLSDKDAIRK